MKKNIAILFSLVVVICYSTITWAHSLWLVASNYHPKVGEPIKVKIGWGHKFPKDEIIEEGILEWIYAIDPEGETVHLQKASSTQFVLTPKLKGTYLVVANIKPCFFSNTTEGRKWGTKKDLKKVIKCTHYTIEAKTVIIAGKKDEGFSRQTGSLLEVIPLESPQQLKQGDILPLKVLFREKPLSHVYLDATYDGFSPEETSIDHKTLKVFFVHKTLVDKKGEAAIKLFEKGLWMVNVNHKIPYPDNKECDEDFYSTILTFEVK